MANRSTTNKASSTTADNLLSEKFLQSKLEEIVLQQLHNATLEFSKNCTESKKLFLAITGAWVVSYLQITGHSSKIYYAGMIIITLLFYLYDAQNYYYQQLLRSLQNKIIKKVTCSYSLDLRGGLLLPLPEKRELSTKAEKIRKSVFNASMFFYWVLLPIEIILLVLHWWGILPIIEAKKPA